MLLLTFHINAVYDSQTRWPNWYGAGFPYRRAEFETHLSQTNYLHNEFLSLPSLAVALGINKIRHGLVSSV